jgi:hypothetical protein
MLTTIAYIVFIASFLGIAILLAKAFADSISIMAEMDRETRISEARHQRMRKMNEEMCKLIRSWGETRIRTIEIMGEIEINRIRKEAENELDSTSI